MDSIAVIILNYMTWQETLKEVEAVRAVLADCPHEIIVVDNCSPNESAEKLAHVAEGNFTFLRSETNGGYAAGNNIGLRYAYEKRYAYSWILNNDIEFTDLQVLNRMLEVFAKDKSIAVVNPDVYSPEGYLFNRDAVKPGVWDFTLGMLSYKKRGRAEEEAKKGWLYIYRPQGCCMLLDTQKAADADFMDEYTFLYCEEVILAERLLRKGYRCACCSATGIIHNHSYTVRKALSKMKYVQSNLRSFDYYLNEYRCYHWLTRVICNLFYALKLFVLD